MLLQLTLILLNILKRFPLQRIFIEISKMLQKEGLDVKMPTYIYFPLGDQQGYLNPIANAQSLAEIRQVLINK